MSKAKYKKYILGSILGLAIIGGALYIGRMETPFAPLASVGEAFNNIFGLKTEFVEVVDTKESQAKSESKEVRVVSALSKSNTVSTSKLDNPLPTIDLKIGRIVYDVEGADEGKERIVIKNHSVSILDISNFSVQYIKLGGTYSSISKKNFESGHHIEGNGEFIVGANCKGTIPCVGVDMLWSQALGNDGGTIYLVSNQENILGALDSDIVDFLQY